MSSKELLSNIIVTDKKTGDNVINFSGNPRTLLVKSIQEQVAKALRISNPNRIELKWWNEHNNKELTLNLNQLTLSDYGMESNKIQLDATVLHNQLPISVQYAASYAGVLVVQIILYLYYFKQLGLLQHLAFFLICVHYGKRTYESLKVHAFSRDSVPAFFLAGTALYYWGLFGFGIGITMYGNPQKDGISGFRIIVGTIAFLVFEFMNHAAHKTLTRLRQPTQQDHSEIQSGFVTYYEVLTRHKIPYGNGYDLVSCAHYFWEICSWFAFAWLTSSWIAYIFAFLTLGILISWSQTKHKRFLAEFDGRDGRPIYPKERKILIPYIY